MKINHTRKVIKNREMFRAGCQSHFSLSSKFSPVFIFFILMEKWTKKSIKVFISVTFTFFLECPLQWTRLSSCPQTRTQGLRRLNVGKHIIFFGKTLNTEDHITLNGDK